MPQSTTIGLLLNLGLFGTTSFLSLSGRVGPGLLCSATLASLDAIQSFLGDTFATGAVATTGHSRRAWCNDCSGRFPFIAVPAAAALLFVRGGISCTASSDHGVLGDVTGDATGVSVLMFVCHLA